MKLWRKSSEEITGFLDHGTNVTGELHFSGTLRIDGNFHGSIAHGDVLVVGEHAVVHADVKVGEIEIHGQVFGSVCVERRSEIFRTGRLRGDLQTPVLVVHEGGIMDGRSSMPSDSSQPQVALVREQTQLGSPEIEGQSEGWTK